MSGKKPPRPRILTELEEMFEQGRNQPPAEYPYHQGTNTIFLPPHIEDELRQLVRAGRKIEAVQRVLLLTGAGLRLSKDYVDRLMRHR